MSLQTILKLTFLFILFCLLWTCSSPTKTKQKTQVSIEDVWIENRLDQDGDGYASDAHVYFRLKTNVDRAEVIIKLGIRESDPMDETQYTLCFQSENIMVEGSSEENSWFIAISNIDYNLTVASYDLLLQVFPGNEPDNIVAEAATGSDSDLGGILLEPGNEDLQQLAEWISLIDDDICEDSFTYYPRYPTGSIFYALAQKFTLPAGSRSAKIKKIAINLPSLYVNPGSLGITIYDDDSDAPGIVLHSVDFENITVTGWNELTVDYDLGFENKFYISVPPSIDYAIGVDNNSSSNAGMHYFYTSSNPPREGWAESGKNYGIKVYVEYQLSGN